MELPVGDPKQLAVHVRDWLVNAVNGKRQGISAFQDEVVAAGGLEVLARLAMEEQYPVALEALQLLCYQHPAVVSRLVNLGMLQAIEKALQGKLGRLEKITALFLLAAMVSFNMECHPAVMAGSLVDSLVQLCRRSAQSSAPSRGASFTKPATTDTQLEIALTAMVDSLQDGASKAMRYSLDTVHGQRTLRTSLEVLLQREPYRRSAAGGSFTNGHGSGAGGSEHSDHQQGGGIALPGLLDADSTTAVDLARGLSLDGKGVLRGRAKAAGNSKALSVTLQSLTEASQSTEGGTRGGLGSPRTPENGAGAEAEERSGGRKASAAPASSSNAASPTGVGARITSKADPAPRGLGVSLAGSVPSLEGQDEKGHAPGGAAAGGLASGGRAAASHAGAEDEDDEDDEESKNLSLQLSSAVCAAMALRNLCHNEANHERLVKAGSVQVLVSMMEDEGQAPAQRINAAMAVALLVGHEEDTEDHDLMVLNTHLMQAIMEVLAHAAQNRPYLGLYWTMWKLLQSCANLAVCEANKAMMLQYGVLEHLAHCLLGRHEQQPLVTRYALVTLWHLAFLDEAKQKILTRNGLVDHIQALLHSGRCDGATQDVAKGCLWTLGVSRGMRALTRNFSNALPLAAPTANQPQPPDLNPTQTLTATSNPDPLAVVVSPPQGSTATTTTAAVTAIVSTQPGFGTSVAGQQTAQPGEGATTTSAAGIAAANAQTSVSKRVSPDNTPRSSSGLDSDSETAETAEGAPVSSEMGSLAPTGNAVLSATTRRCSVVRDSTARDLTHIMISYEWGSQAKALALKLQLEARSFVTWLDLDKMSGSTLEAMALAVEGAVVVLVCVSKKYKESQACRTEAEYAFRLRKRIIPVMMEPNYRPNGWLGALLGTKLYYDMCELRVIPTKVAQLERELNEVPDIHGARGRQGGGAQGPPTTSQSHLHNRHTSMNALMPYETDEEGQQQQEQSASFRVASAGTPKRMSMRQSMDVMSSQQPYRRQVQQQHLDAHASVRQSIDVSRMTRYVPVAKPVKPQTNRLSMSAAPWGSVPSSGAGIPAVWGGSGTTGGARRDGTPPGAGGGRPETGRGARDAVAPGHRDAAAPGGGSGSSGGGGGGIGHVPEAWGGGFEDHGGMRGHGMAVRGDAHGWHHHPGQERAALAPGVHAEMVPAQLAYARRPVGVRQSMEVRQSVDMARGAQPSWGSGVGVPAEASPAQVASARGPQRPGGVRQSMEVRQSVDIARGIQPGSAGGVHAEAPPAQAAFSRGPQRPVGVRQSMEVRQSVDIARAIQPSAVGVGEGGGGLGDEGGSQLAAVGADRAGSGGTSRGRTRFSMDVKGLGGASNGSGLSTIAQAANSLPIAPCGRAASTHAVLVDDVEAAAEAADEPTAAGPPMLMTSKSMRRDRLASTLNMGRISEGREGSRSFSLSGAERVQEAETDDKNGGDLKTLSPKHTTLQVIAAAAASGQGVAAPGSHKGAALAASSSLFGSSPSKQPTEQNRVAVASSSWLFGSGPASSQPLAGNKTALAATSSLFASSPASSQLPAGERAALAATSSLFASGPVSSQPAAGNRAALAASSSLFASTSTTHLQPLSGAEPTTAAQSQPPNQLASGGLMDNHRLSWELPISDSQVLGHQAGGEASWGGNELVLLTLRSYPVMHDDDDDDDGTDDDDDYVSMTNVTNDDDDDSDIVLAGGGGGTTGEEEGEEEPMTPRLSLAPANQNTSRAWPGTKQPVAAPAFTIQSADNSTAGRGGAGPSTYSCDLTRGSAPKSCDLTRRSMAQSCDLTRRTTPQSFDLARSSFYGQEDLASGLSGSWVEMPLPGWSGGAVQEWLCEVGLPELQSLFAAHGLDGRALCGLRRLAAEPACLRQTLKEDVGVVGVATLLCLVEELGRLWELHAPGPRSGTCVTPTVPWSPHG